MNGGESGIAYLGRTLFYLLQRYFAAVSSYPQKQIQLVVEPGFSSLKIYVK